MQAQDVQDVLKLDQIINSGKDIPSLIAALIDWKRLGNGSEAPKAAELDGVGDGRRSQETPAPAAKASRSHAKRQPAAPAPTSDKPPPPADEPPPDDSSDVDF